MSPSFSFSKIISYEGTNIYDIHTERRWGGLKICRVFMDSIVIQQHIYCLFLRMEVDARVKKLVIFCGRHTCMIPNVKKVMFLSLVPVLQWNSHPHTFRMKNNLKYLQESTKTHNFKFLFKKILQWWEKPKKPAKNNHICLVAVLWRCFIRQRPAQDDHFWVVPKVVMLYRFDCSSSCVRYFLFSHQIIVLQKLWKMLLISSNKLFSFSRYSNFCNFFPSFPHFPDSKGQMKVEQYIGFHEAKDLIFGITQKPLYITLLHLVR